jgi:hypothetical protein
MAYLAYPVATPLVAMGEKIAHLIIVCPGRDVTPKLSDLAVIL